MRSPTTTGSRELAKRVPSSAGRSFAWRWSGSQTDQSARTALALVVGPEPPDLEVIWRVYVARFSIEHTYRFFKQVLKWTTPKLRSPEAADRWTWLLVLAYVQLRLARPLVVDHRLPWQAPLPVEKLTPARVRRAFSQLLPTLGTSGPYQNPVGARLDDPKGGDPNPASGRLRSN